MNYSDLPSSHLAPSEFASSRAARLRLSEATYASRAGEYRRALHLFDRSEAHAKRSGDEPARLTALAQTLRATNELERFERLPGIENAARDLLTRARSCSLRQARGYALLGACAGARAAGGNEAESLFNRAVDLGLEAGDREIVAQAAYGSASAVFAQRRFEECAIKLERLDLLLPALKRPEISSAAWLLKGLALHELGRPDEAISSMWRACEALRGDPHLALYVRVLAALGFALSASGAARDARVCLDLAEKTARPDDMPAVRRLIAAELDKLNATGLAQSFGDDGGGEISFDQRAGVVRVNGREIHLGARSLLRGLMSALLANSGRALTKSDLARAVWQEAYEPAAHDNKIYVTVKRLRRCLEDGCGSRAFVMSAKDGYFFNPKMKVKWI